MPNTRSARTNRLAYHFAQLRDRWVKGAWSRSRSGVREKARAAAALDTMEPRVMLTGQLEGVVWYDGNENRERDVNEDTGEFTEPGIPGVRVFVDANNDLTYNVGEINTLTGAGGAYVLENVPAGEALVRVDVPEADDNILLLPDGGYLTFPTTTLTGPPTAERESEYTIEVRFPDDSLSAEQQAVFTRAAARWSEVIFGDLVDVDSSDNTGPIDDLRIDAFGENIDGPSGTLGFARPTVFRSLADGGLPSEGEMTFDLADSDPNDFAFYDTVLHEMGHVLGIGTLWGPDFPGQDLRINVNSADPRYIGPNAVREYNDIFGLNEPDLPLEDTGGAGSRGAHWRDSVFFNELMDSFASGVPALLSRVTVGGLEDLGYDVEYDNADPYAPPTNYSAAGGGERTGYYVALPPGDGIATRVGGYEVVAPPGYRIDVENFTTVEGLIFGIAPIPGEDDSVENRPPIVGDQQFEIISFNDAFDEMVYPDFPGASAERIYVVGEVQAVDVDGRPDDEPGDADGDGDDDSDDDNIIDQTGDNLFYKIVGGNLGDEIKAFSIVKDQAEADRLNNDENVSQFVRPGTIYVQNPFMIQDNIRLVNGEFELQVLVADEDPDSPTPNDGDDTGNDLGVRGGGATLATVTVNLVDYNRIGETGGNNDSIAGAQRLNEGDPDTHQRLNFSLDTATSTQDSFLEPFLDGNMLGENAVVDAVADPSLVFTQRYGAQPTDFVYVDGTISEREASRDIDFYEFQLYERTALLLDVDSLDGLSTADPVNTTLRVFDASGNVVGQTAFDPNGQAISTRGYDFEYYAPPQTLADSPTPTNDVSTSDDRTGDPSLYIELAAGTYYASVEGDFFAGAFDTGEYRLKVTGDRTFDGSVEFGGAGSGVYHNTTDIENDGVLDHTVVDSVFGTPPGTLGSEQFVLYLDFDGLANAAVPAVYGGGTFDLEAFDFNGNPAEFSPGERLAMQNVFRIVAEDFAPYNVNVTTSQDAYDNAANGRYRVVVTETDPSDFIGQDTNIRILPDDAGENGYLFAGNVLRFSPGDNNAVSGRIVASAVETGNYASNLLGLAAGLIPYDGRPGDTNSVYPDAIIGDADTGLNSEYLKRGVTEERFLQVDDLDLRLIGGLGYRNGAADEFPGLVGDKDGQRNTLEQNPIGGRGGDVRNNDNVGVISPLTLQLVGGQGVSTLLTEMGPLDPRDVAMVAESRGVINSAPYGPPDNPDNAVKNESDFDLFHYFKLDTSFIYVDVDEYSSNIDLRVQVFRTNPQGNVVELQDISLDRDPQTGNLVRGGAAVSEAEIEAARRLGIELTESDGYLPLVGANDNGTYFIYVSNPRSGDPQDNDPTRWMGQYRVVMTTQTGINIQPDGPDQTVIRLNEQPEPERTPAGFNPYFPWLKIGEVNLGETASYVGDPQNPDDGGETGQIWEYQLQTVVGNKAGSSTNIDDFDEFLYLDSGTGEIYLTDPSRLDFEEFSVFNLAILVTDNGNPQRTAPVSVDIVLRDVNERPLATDVETSAPEDSERTPAEGRVVGQIAVDDVDDNVFNYRIVEIAGFKGDEDDVLDADGNVVTEGDDIEVFRVTAAGDPGDPRLDIFRIDNLGQIVVDDASFFDFEDYDRFEFVVEATEDRANPNPPVSVNVGIDVVDVNERPMFVPTIGVTVSTQVLEDIANGEVVFRFYRDEFGNLLVLDDDATDDATNPENAEVLTFLVTQATMNNGAPGSAAGVFGFDNSDPDKLGQLLVRNSDEINFENGPDTDNDGSPDPGQTFQLTVRVQDDGVDRTGGETGGPDGQPDPGTILFDTVQVNIEVIDVTPEPPVWRDQTFTIDENAAVGTSLENEPATDDDGDVLTYSIITQQGLTADGMLEDLDPAAFGIDPDTGIVTVVDNSQLSFEQYAQIIITAEVSDGSLTDTAVLTVNLNDVDEEPPTGANPQRFSVPETTAPGVVFGTVAASDPDPGQEVVAFEILSGNEDGLFVIDDEGRLSVAPGETLDFETEDRHVLTVRFFDNDLPATSGTVQVIVDVLDVNEPPVLPTVVLSVEENTPAGVRVNASPIRATDPENNLITYTLVGGNTDDAFAISPASGGGFNVFVNNPEALDFETTEQFTLTVRMRDNGNPRATSTATVIVNVVDVDEFTDIASRVDSTGQWRVWRSSGTDFAVANFGLWSTSIDWSDVMTGDFNGDKRTDIIGRDPALGRWYVGTTTANGQLSTKRWGPDWRDPQNYVDFQVGDFDGDGQDDVAGREITTGRWRVGLSTGTTFTDNLWAGASDDRWNPQTPWTNVRSGDFNGDGRDDLVGQASGTGAYYVALSTGNTFDLQLWDADYGRDLFVDQLVADFDGDGRDDLAARRPATGVWRINYSEGTTFTTVEDAVEWDPAASWQEVRAGEFNGDGRADIVGLDAASRDWFVSLSAGRTLNQRQWADWSSLPATVDHLVGDFDGDGVDDIAGRQVADGRWRVGLARGTRFTAQVWGPADSTTGYVDTVSGQFDVPGEQPANNKPAGTANTLAISGGEFEVDDDAADGTVVGSLTYVGGEAPLFGITGGNAAQAFGLVDRGDGRLDVVVNRASVIDRFTRPDYTLLITGEDGDAETTAVVRIRVVGQAVDADPDDIIALDPETGRWSLARSTGTDFVQTDFGRWSVSVDWQHVQFGDFDGNGLTDVVAQNPASGRWVVGRSNGSRFLFSQWGAAWLPAGDYTDHLVGDFNGDGRDDIAGRDVDTGFWRMGLSTGTTFTNATWGRAWNTSVPWTNVQVGDFNGDGRDDIYALAAGSKQQYVAYSDGTSFNLRLAGGRLDRARDIGLLTIGDFNGDGLDDVAGRSETDGFWHIDQSTGTGFNRLERVTKWTTAGVWDDARALDLDGDGDADLLGQFNGRNWYAGLVDGATRVSSGLWARWPRPSQVLIEDPAFGDFNSDGREDLAGYRSQGGRFQMAVSNGTRFQAAVWGQRDRTVDWAYNTAGQFAVNSTAGGDMGVIAERPADLGAADELDALFSSDEETGDLLAGL